MTAIVRLVTCTPASTIEALMYALRRGLSCLADPGNRDRLRRCDAAAMREIAVRLRGWRDKHAAWLPAWRDDDIELLIDAWSALREEAQHGHR